MQLYTLLPVLIVLGTAASPPAIAAVDGQIGDTSSGRVLIRLELNQGIQISNLQDIEISVDGDTREDIVSRHRFCIRGNTGGSYTITAFSDRAGSSPFTLSSAGQNQIGFEIYFRGDLSKQAGDRLLPNVASPRYTLETKGVNCDGQNNAEMNLVFPASEINQASDDEYSGFLNLTVAID
jgi:hypothetical protein